MSKKRHKTAWTLLLTGVLFFVFFGNFSLVKGRADTPFGWEEISSYTTYYNQNDGGRCENIAISAALIDGVTLQAYGEFSFNKTVGRRTVEAGFQQAKIIVDGQYVLGVGGGVCQVSTTLYNALILAGLTATECHAHSLQVGYVPPSRDAMVSSQSDLCVFNPHSFAVHWTASAKNGALCVRVFGKNEGYRYEIISKILQKVPPPAPIVKEGETEEILRAEKDGLKSESYLECYYKNSLLSKRRLRKDEYRPIQGIVVKKMSKK